MGIEQPPLHGKTIHIEGTVQGVGFRPAVWRLAGENRLVGRVWNSGDGIVMQAWGEESSINRFLQQLRDNPPPLALIEQIRIEPLDGEPPEQFTIAGSVGGAITTAITADAASCPQCITEMMNPKNHRHHYPFTNCTHCGPRFSITRAVPYDRNNTSMAPFTMCSKCQEEYEDPSNRRFHAQPNCCGGCGPQLWLEERSGKKLSDGENQLGPIQHTAKLIQEGNIVAIKGIGGFHLACDAGNEVVVARLRKRKKRGRKPFAVMARDCEMVSRHGAVSHAERELLESSVAPIVTLDQQSSNLAPSISPIRQGIGFMLPYTPLHHLLMNSLDSPIVLTSGNRANEPQCTTNEDAREQLNEIVDYWLLHNRGITNRVDDSVVRVAEGKPRTMRYGRGMAPGSIMLPYGFENSPQMVAMGGELKNSFVLLQNGHAVLSQFVGDLENSSTLREYRNNLQIYQKLFDHHPEAIVVDCHPEYIPTQIGKEWAEQQRIPLIEVQHHHAHIVSCMVEHQLPLDTPPLLGIALDGLGYGDDGEIWGGEFLLANYRDYQRVGNLSPVAMPGGSRAIREPWRNSYAHLAASIGWEKLEQQYPHLEVVQYLNGKPLNTMERMVASGVNSPLASSCGRLIDAVAATVGLCRESISFEGEAAIELESIATQPFSAQHGKGYPYQLLESDGRLIVDWAPMWRELLLDLERETAVETVAARFHHGLINSTAEMAELLCREHNVDTVALGGGVFQNQLLLEGVTDALERRGLTVLSAKKFPLNDQGISLGQGAVAAAQYLSTPR